LKNQNLPNQID
jgi:DNA repair photolyase